MSRNGKPIFLQSNFILCLVSCLQHHLASQETRSRIYVGMFLSTTKKVRPWLRDGLACGWYTAHHSQTRPSPPSRTSDPSQRIHLDHTCWTIEAASVHDIYAFGRHALVCRGCMHCHYYTEIFYAKEIFSALHEILVQNTRIQ